MLYVNCSPRVWRISWEQGVGSQSSTSSQKELICFINKQMAERKKSETYKLKEI